MVREFRMPCLDSLVAKCVGLFDEAEHVKMYESAREERETIQPEKRLLGSGEILFEVG